MGVLTMILAVVYILTGLFLIAVVLLQKGKATGLSGMMGGSSSASDSYWSKNKGRSLEGSFNMWTKIIAITFIVLTIVLTFLV